MRNTRVAILLSLPLLFIYIYYKGITRESNDILRKAAWQLTPEIQVPDNTTSLHDGGIPNMGEADVSLFKQPILSMVQEGSVDWSLSPEEFGFQYLSESDIEDEIIVQRYMESMFMPIDIKTEEEQKQHIPLPGALKSVPKSKKRRNICLEDLDGMGLTSPKSLMGEVNVPFFIFPEMLPEQPLTWLECYKPPSSDPAKDAYGLQIITELETSPWRVFDPSKAAVFLIPDLPMGPSDDERCRHSHDSTKLEISMKDLKMIIEKYPQMTPFNTLIVLGDYPRVKYWRYHSTYLQEKFRKSRDKAVGNTEEKLLNFLLHMRKAVFTGFDTKAYEQDFSALPMTITLDQNLTYSFVDLGVPESERWAAIDAHDDRLEKMRTYEEWVRYKTIEVSGFLQYDDSREYALRNNLFRKHNICESVERKSFEPFMLLGIDLARPNESQACEGLEGDLKDSKTVCCANGHRFKNPIQLTEILDRTKAVIALSGDSIISQNSYEGLGHYSLTFHTQPMSTYEVLLPLHTHVPWVLLGIWDDDNCFLKAQIDETDSAHCLADMLKEFDDLSTKHKKHVHQALVNSGKEIIFDMTGHNAAHNLIFEVAWGLRNSELHKLGLNRESWMPLYPSSCLQQLGRVPPGWIDYMNKNIYISNLG